MLELVRLHLCTILTKRVIAYDKEKWLWLTGSVLVIALLVGAVFGIKYYKESKEIPINLVAMGDSLTEGVGDENKDGGYVGIIPKTRRRTKCPKCKNE